MFSNFQIISLTAVSLLLSAKSDPKVSWQEIVVLGMDET